MIEYENDCCSCAAPGYPCMGSSCPNRSVLHCYCDECGDETDEDDIYEFQGTDYCRSYLLGKFKKHIEEN